MPTRCCRTPTRPLLKASAASAVAEFGWLVFLSGKSPWTGRARRRRAGLSCRSALPLPDVPARAAVWEHCLPGQTSDARPWAASWPAAFRLTPGQIRAAVELARNESRRAEREPRSLRSADLCGGLPRSSPTSELGELAVKIEPRCGWDDLVLPDDQLAQLQRDLQPGPAPAPGLRRLGLRREAEPRQGTQRAVHRAAGHRQDHGRRGASRSELRARPVQDRSVRRGQQVHRRDREEPGAHLRRRPRPATRSCSSTRPTRCSASAPRSSDAHDRYANIETSYLLQKMEEYEGVVILATNLRENLDEAFTRRIRFIVEFPFPEARAGRLQSGGPISRAEAPGVDDIDFAFLAREFQVAGGNIKNIVLNAAFLAAAASDSDPSRSMETAAPSACAKSCTAPAGSSPRLASSGLSNRRAERDEARDAHTTRQ